MSTPLTNWAGNVRFQHRRFHAPESLVQLQNVVRQAQRVRCVGKGHSFNAVADPEDLITLEKMPQELELRGDVVTCSAATTYVELAAFLERNGAALHNLSSTPHVSVMGAIATCTHGSGDGNGNLTSAVRSVVYVDAGGDVREARAGSDELQAIVLGALGVVYSVTLQTQPSYRIRPDRYTGLPWASVDASFDALMSCASSVSLFTRWDASGVQQAWVKRREPVAPATRNFFLGSLASTPLPMVPGMDPASCTPQGEPGAWNERLPHFRAECPPSADGDELQSEYFVAREHASRAMRAMRSVATDLADVLLCGEVRSIAADDFWLSPAYGRRHRLPLHVDVGRGARAIGAAPPRGGARPLRGGASLGEALRHPAAPAVRALRRSAAAVGGGGAPRRPGGQVPQRDARPARGGRRRE